MSIAQEAVARAHYALELEAQALFDARAAEAIAVGRYDSDDCDEAATAAARARLARERAERRHEARVAELATASKALEAEQEANERAELARSIAFVSNLPTRLWPELRALVELDRRVAEIVDRIADAVVEAGDAYANAEDLSVKLQTPVDVQRLGGPPTLAHAALLARVAIARDRARTGRDLANGWVEAAPPPATASDRPAYEDATTTIAALEVEQ